MAKNNASFIMAARLKHYRANLESTLKFHYSQNDGGHQLDHAISVTDTALKINRDQHLGLNPEMICAAAMYHDVLARHRANHEEMAKDYVLISNDAELARFTTEERILVAYACAEHRASYTGKYSSLLSELIATADRGAPTDISTYMSRSVQYAKDVFNDDQEDAERHARQIVIEKFDRDTGTARMPPLYKKVYAAELCALYTFVDSLKEVEHVAQNVRTDGSRRLQKAR